MLLLIFSWKNVIIFIFSLFFIIMLENSVPPSLNFSSPMTYSTMKISSHKAPSPQPPPPPNHKIPLKTSVHFPITITVCKHWSKFLTCSPSPVDCERLSIPKDIDIMIFDYVEQNSYLKIFILWLWEKWAWEGA